MNFTALKVAPHKGLRQADTEKAPETDISP